jgi:hypothetical protein
MSLSTVVPVVALVGFVAYLVLRAAGAGVPRRYAWVVPAVLSALFFALSVRAVVSEGPWGFWVDHISGPWGNQIWVDLLLAASIGWFFAVPAARAAGMNPYPWLVLVVATGSIGFLAMLARLLYLTRQTAVQPFSAPALAPRTK